MLIRVHSRATELSIAGKKRRSIDHSQHHRWKHAKRDQQRGRETKRGRGFYTTSYEGVANGILRKFKETQSEGARDYYQRFLRRAPCPTCDGTRLRPETASVRVTGKSVVDVCRMTTEEALKFFETA